ncbi:MAG: molecular chaperone DnaK [Myxococcota bacterium]
MSDIIVGIDLGTTNSCVSVSAPDGIKVIPNKNGYTITPSVVAITEQGKRLVGHSAKRQAVTNPQNTIFAVKRFIGRPWDSDIVQDAIKRFSYKLTEGPHNDVRIELPDRAYTPAEISSMILTELKLVAQNYLNQPINRAVITVPAYFNDNQRQATKDAGTIAGLKVERIINEPTAAALAFGYGRSLNKTVAVFDLGGGTFDFSLLEINQDIFRVLATSGDTYLGGEDFDARLIDYILNQFLDEKGVNLSTDLIALQRLKDAAERAKHELSDHTSTRVNIPFIATDSSGQPLHLDMTITRETLEILTKDLIEQTFDIIEKALELADITPYKIDDILLVGGQTRMPLVKEMVAKYFGKEPSSRVNPDEAVAIGAAIQAGSLQGRGGQRSTTLLDVTPQNLGIMVVGGFFQTLIPANTAIPTRRKHLFHTVKNDQTQVRIIVLQGDSENAADCELLGEFMLTGLRPAPRGEVEIEVTFDINSDGIVSVAAVDLTTGLKQEIQIVASSGLTPEEIAQMAEFNREHMLEARSDEEFERYRHNIETLLNKLLEAVYLAESESGKKVGKELITKAKELVQQVKAAIGTKNTETLITLTEPLNRTIDMFEKLNPKGGK